jgi:hypothetical protein
MKLRVIKDAPFRLSEAKALAVGHAGSWSFGEPFWKG